jgi:flagellin FlaB
VEKMRKILKRLLQGQRGITGLETAIILIAFVIVASVFAFVTLSTGLFSAERSKETVFAGLQKAQSNLELHGSVVITDITLTGGEATDGTITFQLALAAGGNPISLDRASSNNRVVMNIVDADNRYPDVQYTADDVVGDGDTMLEAGELFTVTIDIGSVTSPAALVLSPNERFAIEVVAPQGGSMLIVRTMPPAIDPVVDLH